MRPKSGALIAAITACAASGVAASPAAAVVDFVTPRRAAYCGTTHGEGAPYLICWTPNDGFTVSMSPRGRSSKSYDRSNRGHHDPAPGRVLRLGRSMTLAGGYRCTSRRTGLTCRNRAGRGWWLGRFTGYQLF